MANKIQDDLIVHKKTIYDESYNQVVDDIEEQASFKEEVAALKKWWQGYQAQETRLIKIKKDKEIVIAQQQQADKVFFWSDILDNVVNFVGAILGAVFKTSLFPLISTAITGAEKNSLGVTSAALSSDDKITKRVRLFSISVSLMSIVPIIVTTILKLAAATVIGMIAAGIDWAKDVWIFGSALVSHLWGSAHQASEHLVADQKKFAAKIHDIAHLETHHPDYHHKFVELQKLHQKINQEIDAEIDRKADLVMKGHDLILSSIAVTGVVLMLFPPTFVAGLAIYLSATAYSIFYKTNPKGWVGHVRDHFYPHPHHSENELTLAIENARKQLSPSPQAIGVSHTRVVMDALAAQPHRNQAMPAHESLTSRVDTEKLAAPVGGQGLYKKAVAALAVEKQHTSAASLRIA